MRKNVASQKIGAQMVTAADGTAFTSSVTVSVTGDAGTQATGSVGSGACTHEGNGYHTYAPAQTETNYDLIAFTFTGTGAVPATVQVFTTANLITDIFASVIDGGYTLLEVLRGFAAALMGKASGLAGSPAVYRDTGDTKNRISATVDANGNRIAVTLDLTA